MLQTLVAEIYGPSEKARLALAERIIAIFKQTPGVVDVDWYIEADQPKARFVIDKEKAALHGISAETISQTLRLAVGGDAVDLLHVPHEKEDINIVLQLPRSLRTTPEEFLALRVRSGDANALPEPGSVTGTPPLIPLRELVRIEESTIEKSLYHKNLMPVTYVIGDVAGVVESPVYAIFAMNKALQKLDTGEFGGDGSTIAIYNASQPFTDAKPAMKWDGEWHITIEVFRDLGLAFAAVLVLIYVLMVGWFRSFLTPLVVMAAIPFSLVGILPGARTPWRVLYGHVDDWIYGRRRHRRAQFDHPGGLHRATSARGHAAGCSCRRRGRRPLSADVHYRHGSRRRWRGHSLRPDLSGARHLFDGW